MADVVRSWWSEPRAPEPPRPGPLDWLLVGAVVVTMLVETAVNPDVAARPLSLAVGLVAAAALPWRRTHPLAMVTLAFGPVVLADFVSLLGPREVIGLYSMAVVLVFAYAVFRWGSGREATLGLALMGVAAGFGITLDYTGVVDSIIGCLVLVFPCVLGLTVRYRAAARHREIDQVRLIEREQFARELHDTVAHHVSAIAIRAQAGQVVAATDPDGARDALAIIEEEASRTLTEMRTMVGALRADDVADLAPGRGLGDLDELARTGTGQPRVEVVRSGELSGLRPSLEAAVFRLAQESVTNALRHARHATRVEVQVTGGPEVVRLVVTDDGDAVPHGRIVAGYGLLGMQERASLLGGSLSAGPGADGWRVEADLPRNGGRG